MSYMCDRQNDDGVGPVLRLLRRPDLREMRRFTRFASVIQEEVPVVWQRRRGAVSRLVDRGARGGLSQKSKKGRRAGALLARGHGGRAQRGGAGAACCYGRRGAGAAASSNRRVAAMASTPAARHRRFNRRARRGDGVVVRSRRGRPRVRRRTAQAQYIYGSACIDHGFVSDGLRWWILAEQRGHAQASLRLSEQHFENAPPEVLGEPSSFARGLDYLHDACVRGSSEAAFSLGVLYYGGRAPHLDADPEVGTAFYRSAAELDHARGCLALADAISQADGDAAEAEKWLHRAAWLGDEDAVRVCKEAGYAPEPPHPSICQEREKLRARSTLAVAAGRAPVVSPKKGSPKTEAWHAAFLSGRACARIRVATGGKKTGFATPVQLRSTAKTISDEACAGAPGQSVEDRGRASVAKCRGFPEPRNARPGSRH